MITRTKSGYVALMRDQEDAYAERSSYLFPTAEGAQRYADEVTASFLLPQVPQRVRDAHLPMRVVHVTIETTVEVTPWMSETR